MPAACRRSSTCPPECRRGDWKDSLIPHRSKSAPRSSRRSPSGHAGATACCIAPWASSISTSLRAGSPISCRAAFAAARGARQGVDAALQPLERVTRETREIGPSELGTRLASPSGQAEVTELAESINRMLERVDRAHRALQSFTADASHELRTPLTHLRAQVQWASEEGRSDSEIRDALAAMERGLDRT